MTPECPQLIVYKLGGSLLELPELTGMLSELIARHPGGNCLFVIGGGPAADVVREWDRIHRLGEEKSHWLALDAMALNERLIHALRPELRLVRSAKQVHAALADRAPSLLCASCFLGWAEQSGFSPLPHTWQVTSDSIAAWVARVLGAGELVLLKSVPCPRSISAGDAASAELVDATFPEIARELPRVSWINVRGADRAAVGWLEHGTPIRAG